MCRAAARGGECAAAVPRSGTFAGAEVPAPSVVGHVQTPRLPTDPGSRAAAAADLARAEAERVPIAPLSQTLPGLDVPGAYEVQNINVRRRLAAGERIAGRKVGLTSLPMQRQLGVDEPDYGVLFESMLIPSGGEVPTRELVAPRAEAEIAFVLGAPLAGPDIGAGEAVPAIREVLLAIEIIDSRIADWKITLPDTIADNASSGRVILGAAVPAESGLLGDLAGETLRLAVDGVEEAKGTGAEVLGDPLLAVAWLARTLHSYGEVLNPGDVVLAGAVHASVDLRPGTRMAVRSDRLPPLDVEIR